MTSAHEKLTGVRYKPVTTYWLESRVGHYQSLPLGTNLRAARRWAQATADAWHETVHLLQRRGYGKANYVPGKALYYPSEVAK